LTEAKPVEAKFFVKQGMDLGRKSHGSSWILIEILSRDFASENYFTNMSPNSFKKSIFAWVGM
jgi:hypothetical protein